MKQFKKLLLLLIPLSIIFISCNTNTGEEPKSDSGFSKAHVTLKTDASGLSTEQKNIVERLKRDNDLGSVKHLYIISSYTGDVLQYSTVDGKVTSGNKRLTPKTVNSTAGLDRASVANNWITLNGKSFLTDEILDDGGAYGDSGNYMYWFDAQGNYHQYYPAGGTYIHISDRPMRIKKANMTLELLNEEPAKPVPIKDAAQIK